MKRRKIAVSEDWSRDIEKYSERILYFDNETWKEFVNHSLFFMIWDVAEQSGYATPDISEKEFEKVLSETFKQIISLDKGYAAMLIEDRWVEDEYDFYRAVDDAYDGHMRQLMKDLVTDWGRPVKW